MRAHAGVGLPICGRNATITVADLKYDRQSGENNRPRGCPPSARVHGHMGMRVSMGTEQKQTVTIALYGGTQLCDF